jgi:hypothetical protein
MGTPPLPQRLTLLQAATGFGPVWVHQISAPMMLGVQVRQEELKVPNFLNVVSKPAFRLLIRHHEVADHCIGEHAQDGHVQAKDQLGFIEGSTLNAGERVVKVSDRRSADGGDQVDPRGIQRRSVANEGLVLSSNSLVNLQVRALRESRDVRIPAFTNDDHDMIARVPKPVPGNVFTRDSDGPCREIVEPPEDHLGGHPLDHFVANGQLPLTCGQSQELGFSRAYVLHSVEVFDFQRLRYVVSLAAHRGSEKDGEGRDAHADRES